MIIERLDDKGRGITHIDGKITFVNNAIEGEDVDIEIIESKKNYNEGKVVKYNKISPNRIQPICPLFNKCGGCDLLHINYEIDYKRKKVKELLKKFADIDIEIKEIISPVELNYRNKATFQVNKKIGYFKKKSYDIIELEKCYLVNNKINNILNEIKKLKLDNINQIVIRASENKDETMVIIKHNGKIDEKFKNLNVTSVISCKDDYEVLKGKDHIIDKIGDLEFVISPDSFFQVNTNGAHALYNKVLEMAKLNEKDRVLDLYCGTGTIGLFVSKYCDSVIGVEKNKNAINDAIKNKKLNHIDNVEFICEDASNVNFKDIDVAIIDPPRSGLDKKTIRYLLNLNLKKIIYVSCDPVTLARDLKELKEKYELKDITLVNMFPKTYHIESVCLLERNNI